MNETIAVHVAGKRRIRAPTYGLKSRLADGIAIGPPLERWFVITVKVIKQAGIRMELFAGKSIRVYIGYWATGDDDIPEWLVEVFGHDQLLGVAPWSVPLRSVPRV